MKYYVFYIPLRIIHYLCTIKILERCHLNRVKEFFRHRRSSMSNENKDKLINLLNMLLILNLAGKLLLLKNKSTYIIYEGINLSKLPQGIHS